MSKTDDEKNGSSNIRDSNTDDVTSKDRLQILKIVLYYGGAFYVVGSVAPLFLSHPSIGWHMQSEAIELLEDLLNPLGYALTLIIGAIMGSSIGGK